MYIKVRCRYTYVYIIDMRFVYDAPNYNIKNIRINLNFIKNKTFLISLYVDYLFDR